MSEIVSTIKPEGPDFEEQPIVDVKKYWTSLEQAKKAFREQGLTLIKVNQQYVAADDSSEQRMYSNVGADLFFTKVDISKDPITQTITVMHRQKAVEYYKDKDGREKQKVKEFLTYGVTLEGSDWLGNALRGHLEFEGHCPEPRLRAHVKVDENGRQTKEFLMQGVRHKYYIPFSKKAVDDLLEKTGTDKNTVKFYGKFSNDGGVSMRTSGYTYGQFVDSDWETFEGLARREGGPTGKVQWIPKPNEKQYVG